MRPSARSILGLILILTALVTVAYWVNYFTSGDVAAVRERWYTVYESSFPAADGWLAVCALLAGMGFCFDWASAARFGLMAGSALIYLAAMDVTFDIENHLYPLAAHSEAMRSEIVINAWSLLIGLATIFASWRRAAAGN